MIIEEALLCSERLNDSDSAKLDTELLLASALGKTRTYLVTWPERVLTQAQEDHFHKLLARRAAGEPVAYILKSREFWSLPLEVGPSTLIPRPDTEVLVEASLDAISQASSPTILDLGTGTGAVALALAKEVPSAKVEAVDFNQEAVALAEHNRSQLNIPNVAVYKSDWFCAVQGFFDLIVSNPPYIDGADPHLKQGDVRFEPSSALVAQNHGLADLQWIIQQSPPYLNTGAWLLLEHGCNQAKAVRALLSKQGFTDVFTRKDYGDNERVSGGRWTV